MRIDELSKIANVSKRTIRYYEELGLLKPIRETESNYRIYQRKDIDTLQHILFYKRLGFELDDIKRLIQDKSVIKTVELTKHLKALEKEKAAIEVLINTVRKTILYEKGVLDMTNQEKFEGFKQKMLDDNEKLYKDEVIKQYGEKAYQQSKNAFSKMNEQDYKAFEQLSMDIITYLKKALDEGGDPTSMMAQKAAKSHQLWLSQAWGSYDIDAHLNIVDMYLSDDRFKQYYDQHQTGMAQLLRDAVYHMLIND
jgi:DNA-binding transcriptional MerR regulator